MPLRIAFQMDPLERLFKRLDSTLEIARPVAEQGHELFHYEPRNLRMNIETNKVSIMARAHKMIYTADAEDPWSLAKDEEECDLSTFNIILMRQDPPFDLTYITATHILEHLKDKVRIVNDPVGVRNAPEKLLITHFPHLMPPTVITRDRLAIEDFRRQYQDIILKPLHGFAGHGVFHLRADDDNLPGLLETLGAMNSEPWMIQRYLAVEKFGDKRIVVLEGDPVGAFVRMPAKGDVRGNMRVGAQPQKTEITKRDHEICEIIAASLRERGLFLAGLDVIGDYLTEINVTSPTGLKVADRLQGRSGNDRIAEQFWRRLNI